MSLESLDRAELSELIDQPRLLKQGVSKVKAMNDYLATNREIKTVTFDNMAAQKIANNERYWFMWENGDKLIANHILLEEGLPQMLSPRQEVFLAHVDEQYNLISLNDHKGSI